MDLPTSLGTAQSWIEEPFDKYARARLAQILLEAHPILVCPRCGQVLHASMHYDRICRTTGCEACIHPHHAPDVN